MEDVVRNRLTGVRADALTTTVLLLFVASAMAGCGSNETRTQPEDSGTTGVAEPAPEPEPPPPAPVDATPVIVVETNRGTFEIEMYRDDAPRTVEHILALVKRRFYNGTRIHRVEPGFVIQFGDPQTRDMSKQYLWGNGGSGSPIGVAEIKRPHRVGAVAMAHAGDPRGADSQMYVALSTERTRSLDSGYTVFGQFISGMDVVQKTEPRDTVVTVSVKDESASAK